MVWDHAVPRPGFGVKWREVAPLAALLMSSLHMAELEAYHRRFVELVCVKGNTVAGCKQIERVYPNLYA